MATLLQDPAFQGAWDNVMQAMKGFDPRDPATINPAVARTDEAFREMKAALDARPDLVALIEAAETE